MDMPLLIKSASGYGGYGLNENEYESGASSGGIIERLSGGRLTTYQVGIGKRNFYSEGRDFMVLKVFSVFTRAAYAERLNASY